MCSIASSSESTTPTAIFRPWYSVSQSSSVASPTGIAACRPADPLVADQLDPGAAQLGEHAGQELRRDVGVDEQRLRRVAHPRPLHLRVVGDPPRRARGPRPRARRRGSCPAAAYITGTVATSFSAAFRPSPPRGITRSTTPSCVASSASSVASPPPSSSTEPSGSPASATASRISSASTAFERAAYSTTPQHDRVAALQASARRSPPSRSAAPRRRRRPPRAGTRTFRSSTPDPSVRSSSTSPTGSGAR